MNTYQQYIPQDFHPNARVWIYQCNRPLRENEVMEIDDQLHNFYSQWLSHGAPVKGWAKCLYNQFIVVMADDTADKIGGCSTDGMVRIIKSFERQYSVELFDRSSPAFIDELMRNMAAQYAKVTDTAVNAALIAGATADATTTTTYPTAAELLGIIARGAASVYNGTQGFAKNIIMNTSQWSNVMTLNDSGRPIYNASQPQNAGGAVRVDSIRGNVAGLDLYVTANTAATTDTTPL
jgi:hypothetical protein